jgi:hypothetical protein
LAPHEIVAVVRSARGNGLYALRRPQV